MGVQQLYYRGLNNKPAKKMSGATFIYVKEESEFGELKVIEIERPRVRVLEADSYRDRFYQFYKSDIKIAMSLEVKKFYIHDWQDAQLQYVIYKKVRYRVYRHRVAVRDTVLMDLEEDHTKEHAQTVQPT